MFCKLRDPVQVRGDLHGERHLAPDNFMKYLLATALIVLPLVGHCQYFNGSVYDSRSGRVVQTFEGNLFEPAMTRHEEIMEGYRLERERREALEQHNLRIEEIRLLREIANK